MGGRLRFPLDIHDRKNLSLCQVFADQLARGQDLLDDPAQCQANPQCPLTQEEARDKTVCPFGFWGFRHQIEQPAHSIDPTPVDHISGELDADRDPSLSPFLARAPGSRFELRFLAWPHFPDVETHEQEIRGLSSGGPLNVEYSDARNKILELLRAGGAHLYYFFCHGEVVDSRFTLRIDPSRNDDRIGTANLDRRVRWPAEPRPLVFFNGCDTAAMLPETINDFVTRLRRLGASGAIGTEIKVSTVLAREVAQLVLDALLGGASLGEAFLTMRRALLRRYNPLGLAYSFFALATLHLHDPAAGACVWCKNNLAAQPRNET